MSRLLVTGSAGFICSNFIYYWLSTHPDAMPKAARNAWLDKHTVA